MKLRGRKVLVCGCEATMPPDGKALAKGVRRRRGAERRFRRCMVHIEEVAVAPPTANALEKLTSGISTLVTHPGPIKGRLVSAYIAQISYIKLTDVSERFRRSLEQIHEIMTGSTQWAEGEAPEPGVVRQAVHLMSDDDAVEAAGAILALYDDVRSAGYERDG